MGCLDFFFVQLHRAILTRKNYIQPSDGNAKFNREVFLMANAGKPVPIKYMLDCPLESLSNLQLQGLCEAANLRKEIAELETQARDAELKAETARFMMQHRDLIKDAALKRTDAFEVMVREEKEEERREKRRQRRRLRRLQQRGEVPYQVRRAG